MAKKKSEELYFIDKKTEKKISYISSESLIERHPEGKYSITGEIYVKNKEESGIKKQLDKETEIYIQKIGTYKESRYKTIGYIPYEAEKYIAVKKKKNFLIWIFLFSILIMLVLGTLFLVNKEKNQADIDPNAGDYSSALKRPDNINDSQILVPGYGKFTIKKGNDTIDTALFNPEGNPCFFKFTLIEKATNKVLYESKLVPPGKGITPIKINKSFDKTGSYDAVLKFQSFDLEDTEIEYNGSDIDVRLNVVE